MSNEEPLVKRKCIPCENGNTPILSKGRVETLLKEISEWMLVQEGIAIEKKYTFKDFKESMKFVTLVAQIAEAEGHHPDILISYNKVTCTLSTHSIGGLTENDFIVAAKINEIKI